VLPGQTGAPDPSTAHATVYRAQLVRHGVADADAAVALLDLDIELNAQGLGVWLDRGHKA
jgi:hypothetical protein